MIEDLVTAIMIGSTVNMLILLLISILVKIKFTPNWLIKMLCPKCISFWVGLILFQSILIGGAAAHAAYLIDKYTID